MRDLVSTTSLATLAGSAPPGDSERRLHDGPSGAALGFFGQWPLRGLARRLAANLDRHRRRRRRTKVPPSAATRSHDAPLLRDAPREHAQFESATGAPGLS